MIADNGEMRVGGSRADTIARASGQPAHSSMISSTARTPTLAVPRRSRRTSRLPWRPQESVSRVSRRPCARDESGQPVAAGHDDVAAGRAGQQRLTCSTSRALSDSSTSTRRSDSSLRYRPVCASSCRESVQAGMPSASRKPRSAFSGVSAMPLRVEPRHVDCTAGVGKQLATECAQCTARRRLPAPGMPSSATGQPAGGSSSDGSNDGGTQLGEAGGERGQVRRQLRGAGQGVDGVQLRGFRFVRREHGLERGGHLGLGRCPARRRAVPDGLVRS